MPAARAPRLLEFACAEIPILSPPRARLAAPPARPPSPVAPHRALPARTSRRHGVPGSADTALAQPAETLPAQTAPPARTRAPPTDPAPRAGQSATNSPPPESARRETAARTPEFFCSPGAKTRVFPSQKPDTVSAARSTASS